MKARVNRPNAAEILRTVPPDKAFLFFEDIGKYTGKTALNLADFLQDIQTIPPNSVTFHFKRGDFDKWIHDTLNDPTLAARIRRLKKSYTGKELRRRISKLVEKRLKELQPHSH